MWGSPIFLQKVNPSCMKLMVQLVQFINVFILSNLFTICSIWTSDCQQKAIFSHIHSHLNYVTQNPNKVQNVFLQFRNDCLLKKYMFEESIMADDPFTRRSPSFNGKFPNFYAFMFCRFMRASCTTLDLPARPSVHHLSVHLPARKIQITYIHRAEAHMPYKSSEAPLPPPPSPPLTPLDPLPHKCTASQFIKKDLSNVAVDPMGSPRRLP